jgi:hypothetical protein
MLRGTCGVGCISATISTYGIPTVEASGNKPAGRFNHGLAASPISELIYMFGGMPVSSTACYCQGLGRQYCNDL